MRQIFLLLQGVPRTGLEPDTFPGRMKISSARIRGIFTSILLLRFGRGELFSVLTGGARRRLAGLPIGWRLSMIKSLCPNRSFTDAATSFCSLPIRRRIGRVWVLRPWQAGVCLLWTGAEGGNKWCNTGRPDGCANAPGISSRTPLKWLGSPTTGKTWPLPPVSGAWPWAGRKLPWKAGRRCLRQSAGYLIPNCRFCSDRNANRFFPADQMSHVPYWRRFFCLSML